ncbi:MAG: hypothetical protein LBQ24_04070 [Candidatus Peribacteria bacterium]|nr:hypothetical protein [Candidatus Peribacteria bacterium]
MNIICIFPHIVLFIFSYEYTHVSSNSQACSNRLEAFSSSVASFILHLSLSFCQSCQIFKANNCKKCQSSI